MKAKGIAGFLIFAVALGAYLYTESRSDHDSSTSELSPLTRAILDGKQLRVSRVVDGDTIRVELEGIEERVRLLQIDTPERDESFYREATAFLEECLADGTCVLEFEKTKKVERDKYSRLLCYVFDANRRNLNVEIVRAGWSTHVTRYGHGRFYEEFAMAESEAKKRKRGIWRSR